MRLEANTFEGLGELKFLILKHGSLSQIDVGAFNGLDNLEVLYLHSNKIIKCDKIPGLIDSWLS
jgi:hypothetical protein